MAARKNASIQSVAEAAGVSTATVSRVLNNDSRVARATREKVLAAVREQGYRLPRSASRQAKRIGIVVMTEESVYYMALAAEIHRVMRGYGYQAVFGSIAGGQAPLEDVLDTLYDCKVAGVVLIACPYASIASCLAPSVEHVWIDCNDELSARADVCSVQSDHYYAGQLAAQEFLRAGRTRPVVLTSAHASHRAKDRERGLTEELARNGVEFTHGQIISTSGLQQPISTETREALRYAASSGDTFDAVWAIADERALGARQALRELGIDVPGDVGLLGFDGVSPAVRELSGITSIAQNVPAIAAQACRMLVALIDGEEIAERHVVVPVSVLRGRTL